MPKEKLSHAEEVVRASMSLDYQAILAHEEKAIARLNRVLQKLNINPARVRDHLGNYASPQATGKGGAAPPPAEPSKQERIQQLIDELTKEGFGERIDKVYNSFSKERTTPIDKVPHHRGLPKFQLVLAPDFAPVSGMHGIFIVGNSVRSFVLPSDSQGGWQLVKEKGFSSTTEMVELVTLISAGFDID